MFLDGEKLYQVLDRCEDLFPEWKREGSKFWNSKTGEIIYDNGVGAHDLVYRGHEAYNIDFDSGVIRL